MLSNRPYLLRAFYQWIVDSGCAPILVIDANYPQHTIPQEYAEEGEIIFNISPSAIRDLNIGNDSIEFRASFSGVVHLISISVKAILALYAEENGEGIFFDADEEQGESSGEALRALEGIPHIALSEAHPGTPIPSEKSKNKPFLRLVEKTSE